MRAAVMHAFGEPLRLEAVADPAPAPDGVVVEVRATGVCRSDWHAWMGHDPGIRLPHVPGHELAGVVVAAGPQVRGARPGDRVTVPFCCGCGRCEPCRRGETQVCEDDYQPGFTGWGSFARYVALPRADLNLVALPDALGFVEAAALGCRFMTAWAAVHVHGRVAPGEWVAVHGCGGVGTAAIMIAAALGAAVVAVDVEAGKLERAKALGAAHAVDARDGDPATAILELTAAAPTCRSTRSAAPPPARRRCGRCAARAATCRSGSCWPTSGPSRCRWRASSPTSSSCSACTGWRSATTAHCCARSPAARSCPAA